MIGVYQLQEWLLPTVPDMTVTAVQHCRAVWAASHAECLCVALLVAEDTHKHNACREMLCYSRAQHKPHAHTCVHSLSLSPSLSKGWLLTTHGCTQQTPSTQNPRHKVAVQTAHLPSLCNDDLQQRPDTKQFHNKPCH